MYEYPYGVGEQFFETEINYLKDNFSDIIIFSINGGKKRDLTRKCPQNVKVFPLSCSENKFMLLAKGLLSKDKLFTKNHSSFKEKILYKYYIGKKNHIFNKVIECCKRNNLDFTDSILYSYWLSFAPVLVEIRDFYEKNGIKGLKTISRAHGYDLFWDRMPLGYSGLQSKSIELIDCVYSISETGKNYLIQKYPEFSHKIQCQRLGSLDNGNFINPENKNFAFVTCSDNRKLKRLDLFAEAFNSFVKKNPNSSWHAIGIDSNEPNILSKLNADSLSKVHFYGNVPNKSVPAIYKHITPNCFVNVSNSEGLSVAIMEAMSYGTPIIATDVGGTSELVDSENGLLLKPNPSVNDIVNAMVFIYCLSDADSKNMRRHSRNKWDKFVNADVNYKKWVEILKSL